MSGGSVGVSRAITYRSAFRPSRLRCSQPGPVGVIRIPLSPRATAASIALTWVSVSPSLLPAAVVIETPFFSPAALAPSCMAMKNGLVLVLVINVTATLVPAGVAGLTTGSAGVTASATTGG